MRTDANWISKTKGEPRTGYYEDADDFSKLPTEKIEAVCAFCYSIRDKKWVIVWNGSNLVKNWEPIAGHIEPGEKPTEALIREIKEESNMRVLKYFPLGYLYIREVDIYQVQYLCVVEPYGPFVSDPDGGVSEIRLVNFEEIPGYLTTGDTSRITLSRCEETFKKLQIGKK